MKLIEFTSIILFIKDIASAMEQKQQQQFLLIITVGLPQNPQWGILTFTE